MCDPTLIAKVTSALFSSEITFCKRKFLEYLPLKFSKPTRKNPLRGYSGLPIPRACSHLKTLMIFQPARPFLLHMLITHNFVTLRDSRFCSTSYLVIFKLKLKDIAVLLVSIRSSSKVQVYYKQRALYCVVLEEKLGEVIVPPLLPTWCWERQSRAMYMAGGTGWARGVATPCPQISQIKYSRAFTNCSIQSRSHETGTPYFCSFHRL